MSNLRNLNVLQTCTIFVCGMMGCCKLAGVESFVVHGPTRMTTLPTLKVIFRYEDDGDDFAWYYGDEQFSGEQQEEGRVLAQEFYQEVKMRRRHDFVVDNSDDFRTSQGEPFYGMKSFPSKNPRAMNSAGFFNANRKTTVYSESVGKDVKSSGTTIPLPPPKPTYGSSTQLGISGMIVVLLLLLRHFWVQALVTVGMIALVFLLVAATASDGGEWLGTSVGSTSISNNTKWCSSVNDGVPVIERITTTRTFTDNDDSLNM